MKAPTPNIVLAEISEAILNLDPNVSKLVEKSLQAGFSAEDILNGGLSVGLEMVGKKHETGEYFLPELLMAGQLMQDSLEILKGKLTANVTQKSRGRIIIGTVKDDVHSLGKDIVSMMLGASGFEVIDLGTNVNKEDFVAKLMETNAEIIALSALMTTTMKRMEEVIQLLQERGLRDRVKVIIGGAPVSQKFADQIGADAFGRDASEAMRIAKNIIRM